MILFPSLFPVIKGALGGEWLFKTYVFPFVFVFFSPWLYGMSCKLTILFSLKHSIWKLNEVCVANTAQGIQSGERVWFESALMGSDGWCGGY